MGLSLFVLGFGSLTVAILLNNELDSKYLGYLVITCFYFLVLAGIVILNRSGKLTQVIEDILMKRGKAIADKFKEKNG